MGSCLSTSHRECRFSTTRPPLRPNSRPRSVRARPSVTGRTAAPVGRRDEAGLDGGLRARTSRTAAIHARRRRARQGPVAVPLPRQSPPARHATPCTGAPPALPTSRPRPKRRQPPDVDRRSEERQRATALGIGSIRSRIASASPLALAARSGRPRTLPARAFLQDSHQFRQPADVTQQPFAFGQVLVDQPRGRLVAAFRGRAPHERLEAVRDRVHARIRVSSSFASSPSSVMPSGARPCCSSHSSTSNSALPQ